MSERYFCDICGKEFVLGDEMHDGLYTIFSDVHDACTKCNDKTLKLYPKYRGMIEEATNDLLAKYKQEVLE